MVIIDSTSSAIGRLECLLKDKDLETHQILGFSLTERRKQQGKDRMAALYLPPRDSGAGADLLTWQRSFVGSGPQDATGGRHRVLVQ